MRLIKDFNLVGKTFCFNFHRYNCHMVATGSCSLFDSEWTSCDPGHKETEKAHPNHCPYVSWLMKNHPKHMLPIYVYKYKCGHYQTGQGQHRLCISGNQRNRIPVTLDTIKDKLCGFCENPESFILKTF